MDKVKKYLKIFISFMFVSTFTFGGGYVILPLMRKRFVNELKWLEDGEMMDIISIAQSSPGSLAVNAAILVGYKVAGVLGTVFAVLGTVLPSVVIVILLSIFYGYIQDNFVAGAILKGMQAGVAALICDISITMFLGVVKNKSKLSAVLSVLLMAAAFSLIFFLKVSVIYVILACIAIGAVLPFIKTKKKEKEVLIAPEEISSPEDEKNDIS